MSGPNGAPYCLPDDLVNYSPSAQVLARATSDQKMQACLDATAQADSYLRGRYTLPLLAWGPDVRRYTAQVALFLLLDIIGWRPADGSNSRFLDRYYEAMGNPSVPGSGWFPGIQREAIHPDVTPSIPPQQDAVHKMPIVSSDQPRGWQQFNARGRPVI